MVSTDYVDSTAQEIVRDISTVLTGRRSYTKNVVEREKRLVLQYVSSADSFSTYWGLVNVVDT